MNHKFSSHYANNEHSVYLSPHHLKIFFFYHFLSWYYKQCYKKHPYISLFNSLFVGTVFSRINSPVKGLLGQKMYVFYNLTDLKICYFPKNLFPKGYNNLHCQHITSPGWDAVSFKFLPLWSCEMVCCCIGLHFLNF